MKNRNWDKDECHHEKIKKSKREWYYRNKDKVDSINKRNRMRAAEWVKEFKKKCKCQCGESHIATLDFHHIDPMKKEFQITNVVHRGWSIPKIKKEVEKCIVMCANCHRKLHWNIKHAVVSEQSSKL